MSACLSITTYSRISFRENELHLPPSRAWTKYSSQRALQCRKRPLYPKDSNKGVAASTSQLRRDLRESIAPCSLPSIEQVTRRLVHSRAVAEPKTRHRPRTETWHSCRSPFRPCHEPCLLLFCNHNDSTRTRKA